MAHIGIIGGGLAGLTAAFRRLSRGDTVTVLEASSRLGGQLFTVRDAPYLIEHGAEGFVAGSEAVARLAADLGIAEQILNQSVTTSCHFDGKQLVRLPPGAAGRLLGFQVNPRALGKGIQAFVGGMSQLTEVLAKKLVAAEVKLNARVQSVRRSGDGWQLLMNDAQALSVDRVVVATTARGAAPLLDEMAGGVARSLGESEALSSVTVSLAFALESIRESLDATGFVVADDAQQDGFRACTYVSSKLSGRCPSRNHLLRVFLRPTPDELATLSDAQWAARAHDCASRALTITAPPTASWVSRWDRALPVFDAAHKRRVEALEEKLGGSGVLLAGAAFHGAGIDGAVRSAERAIEALG